MKVLFVIKLITLSVKLHFSLYQYSISHRITVFVPEHVQRTKDASDSQSTGLGKTTSLGIFGTSTRNADTRAFSILVTKS